MSCRVVSCRGGRASHRGTGEQSFLRTESDFSSGANETSSTSKVDSQQQAGPVSAPRVVSKTPGSEVLEKMFLERVFGSAASASASS